MTGLMIKDLRLLLQRKQTVLIFLAMTLIIGFTMEGTFIIGFMSILFAVYAIGTIGYDEADNGFPFLMTLPIKRSDYVKAKYLFCLLAGLCGWVLSVAIFIIASNVKGITLDIPSELLMAVMFIPVILTTSSILIAVQLKFGVEKSRIIIMLSYGVIAAIGVVGNRLFEGTDIGNSAWSESLSKVSDGVIFALGLLVSLAISMACYLWSLSFMNKKEF